MGKRLISVVAPMFNEEDSILEYCRVTLNALKTLSDRYNVELILVNDGSRDGTLGLMHQVRQADQDLVTIVNLSRNFGLEGAVSAGLHKAAGDAIIVMDADLQDPPALISVLVQKWEEGADVVSACRVRRASDDWFKRASANLFYGLMNALAGKIVMERKAANYRLISRRALDQILSLPEVNSVFRVEVPFIGMRRETVEYERDKRAAGKTKYNLKTMVPYALDSLTSLSVVPLHKLIYTLPLGALFILGSIGGLVFSNGSLRIGFMICVMLSVLFEILFVSVVLVAEYVAQIMTEVKGRPTFIIYEYLPCNNAKR